ncbi:GNAT family N-acetyltransferase [Kushneria aurantia]|uniref:GNAT family N-acetyltransferase n=1 Tax=Kushneria aurantia TaxID=504092 RepID=A0ABV6G008_9GAMM|nr:GNAT family N-acetyltransferase [Kushneria aurantia]
MSDNIAVTSGDWQTLGAACRDIRERVFIHEQGVSEAEEIDGLDPHCIHFLMTCRGQPCGTARLLTDGHIGRVALLASFRGRGLGREMVRAIIDVARQRGHDSCLLAAQTQALGFYESLGFRAQGDVFMEAGIAHREMKLALN